jgi:cytoskeletal protein CcmA (bactofilin family)
VADNDVEIHGEIHGTVEGKGQVLVAEGSKVEAALHARVVVVAGEVVGDVSADDKVELRPSAVLRGNITAPRVVIQDGATFEGQVFMQKPDAKKTSAAAATAAPAPGAPDAPKPANETAERGEDGDPARPHNRNRR